MRERTRSSNGKNEYGANEARTASVRKEFREEERPLIDDLAAIGFHVESVRDVLQFSRADYAQCVPVLLHRLQLISNESVKESVVRVLTTKTARPAATLPLIREFEDSENFYYKWAVGNALSVVADDSVFDELKRLALDEQHGKAREMLVLALGNMRNPDTVPVLMELLKDDELTAHSLSALGKLRARAARSEVEKFLGHPRALVRKQAKLALKRIDQGQPDSSRPKRRSGDDGGAAATEADGEASRL
jgi:HEAT repeat protein